MGQAMACRGLCLYEASLALADEALPLYIKDRDNEGEAFVLYCRGGALRFLGRLKAASASLERSLELTHDPAAARFTLMALGGLRRMQGRAAESLELYGAARRRAGRARDHYAMAYADCGIGNAWRIIGNTDMARRYLDEADRRYRSIHDRVSRPYTLFAMSLLALEQNGRSRIPEARKLFTATGDARGLVYCDLADAFDGKTGKTGNTGNTGNTGKTGKTGTAAARKRSATRALRQARSLGLALETAHALYLLKGASDTVVRKAYKALGIAPPATPFLIP